MGKVPSCHGTQAALSSLHSAHECEGQVLEVAVGETEQKTPELCTGQAGVGGLSELLSVSVSVAEGSHRLLSAGGLYLEKVCLWRG